MAGCIDNIDQVFVPVDRAVLGPDGDSPLPFQSVVIHQALGHLLVVAESMSGAKDRIDQGSLAVIDMGDDREITNFFRGMHTAAKPSETLGSSRLFVVSSRQLSRKRKPGSAKGRPGAVWSAQVYG